ncbi:hypothetical protein MRB53_038621 [Persea americana]|nr:hypothetical protein MRB53_038621 [Persea americana]
MMSTLTRSFTSKQTSKPVVRSRRGYLFAGTGMPWPTSWPRYIIFSRIQKLPSTDRTIDGSRLLSRTREGCGRCGRTMRDIIYSLMPQSDQQRALDIMDVELIMQQIQHNSMNLPKFFTDLAAMLKCHCAPMRDREMDNMALKFVEAAREVNTRMLADAFREVFHMLECMKIDIANHQIRTYRAHFLDRNVTFEQDWLSRRSEERIRTRGVDCDNYHRASCRSWAHASTSSYEGDPMHKRPRQTPVSMDRFMQALTHNLLPQCFNFPVDVFQMDLERLQKIADDVRFYANQCIALQQLTTALKTFQCTEQRRQHARTEFMSALYDLVLPKATAAQWLEAAESIAIEIMRCAHAHAPAAIASRLTPAGMISSGVTGMIEGRLVEAYSSQMYRQQQLSGLEAALTTRVSQLVQASVNLSPEQMWISLVGNPVANNKANSGTVTGTCVDKDELKEYSNLSGEKDVWVRRARQFDDICRRAAHVAAFHWRVNSELVWLTGDVTFKKTVAGISAPADIGTSAGTSDYTGDGAGPRAAVVVPFVPLRMLWKE